MIRVEGDGLLSGVGGGDGGRKERDGEVDGIAIFELKSLEFGVIIFEFSARGVLTDDLLSDGGSDIGGHIIDGISEKFIECSLSEIIPVHRIDEGGIIINGSGSGDMSEERVSVGAEGEFTEGGVCMILFRVCGEGEANGGIKGAIKDGFKECFKGGLWCGECGVTKSGDGVNIGGGLFEFDE